MNKVPTLVLLDPRWHGLGYIKAAAARNYRVIPIVPYKEHPAKHGYEGKYHKLIVNNLDETQSVIKAIEEINEPIDAIIPGNCYFTPMANQIAEHFNLKHEPYEAALRSRLKDLGRKAYDAAGILNTKFAIVHDLEEALHEAKKIGYPIILKPTDGGGSEHVTLNNNEAELTNNMQRLLAYEKTSFDRAPRQVFLLEEYITGQEFSVELFIQDKKIKYGSVTEKISSEPPYFIEIGHVVPTSVYTDRVDELIDASLKAVLALGFSNGPFHVEIRLSSKGPIIMETNGRVGGGLIATDLIVNAFGVNLFDGFIQYLLGRPYGLTPTKKSASCIANLISKKSGKINSINGVENLSQQKNIVKYDVSVKPGDNIKAAKENADRIGYVISIADTPAEAKKSAFDTINCVTLDIS